MNLITIGTRFVAQFRDHTTNVYSDALHPLYNDDDRCGNYVWLEIYLCFRLLDNPFNRFDQDNLIVHELRPQIGIGHRGPVMRHPENRPGPLRDRLRPFHQLLIRSPNVTKGFNLYQKFNRQHIVAEGEADLRFDQIVNYRYYISIANGCSTFHLNIHLNKHYFYFFKFISINIFKCNFCRVVFYFIA